MHKNEKPAVQCSCCKSVLLISCCWILRSRLNYEKWWQ
jgi:hypothetical protein